MSDKKDLADCITGMNYGDLKAIGRDLADACGDRTARPKLETAEEFADLLFDWAEAQG